MAELQIVNFDPNLFEATEETALTLGALVSAGPEALVYRVVATRPEFAGLLYRLEAGGASFVPEIDGSFSGTVTGLSVFEGSLTQEALLYSVSDFELPLDGLLAGTLPGGPFGADIAIFSGLDRIEADGPLIDAAALFATSRGDAVDLVAGQETRDDTVLIGGLSSDFSGEGEPAAFRLSGTDAEGRALTGDLESIEFLQFDDATISTAEFLAPPQVQGPRVGVPIPDQVAIAGTPFSFAVPPETFVDANGDALTLAGAGLPDFLSFDPATATLSGTPPANGSGQVSVAITATDGVNAPVIDVFELSVIAPAPFGVLSEGPGPIDPDFQDAGVGLAFVGGVGGLIDGGPGADVVVYSGPRNEAIVTGTALDGVVVAFGSVVDTLVRIEEIDFTDGSILLDLPGAAAVYSFYTAGLATAPDANGLRFWADLANQGVDRLVIAQAFVDSPAFAARLAGDSSDTAFVEALYDSAMGRDADTAGRDFWTAALDAGLARGEALIAFADSEEHQELIEDDTEPGFWVIG